MRDTNHLILPLLQHQRSTPGQKFQDGRVLGLDIGRHGFINELVIAEEMQLPAGTSANAVLLDHACQSCPCSGL